MEDWDTEEYLFDEEDKADDQSGEQLECIECGELGYPVDENRPFMCFKCKLQWQ